MLSIAAPVLNGRAPSQGPHNFSTANSREGTAPTPGAKRASAIMQQEIEITLKQIGCPGLEVLGPHFLLDGDR